MSIFFVPYYEFPAIRIHEVDGISVAVGVGTDAVVLLGLGVGDEPAAEEFGPGRRKMASQVGLAC